MGAAFLLLLSLPRLSELGRRLKPLTVPRVAERSTPYRKRQFVGHKSNTGIAGD